jgi:hypothetical protein
MFDLRLEEVKRAILDELSTGPKCVDLFYNEWVIRPDDLYCHSAYREALLELERERRIEVLDKDGATPKPSTARRIQNGKRTLGSGHYVRLKPQSV